MQWDVRTYDEVTSTNDLVKDAIAGGAPEGVVAVARTQTGGYGRRGHAWSSGPGGLYMSVLLRPQRSADELATLSLVTAVAVRRALASFLPAEMSDTFQIKWPNDVVVKPDAPASGEFAGFQKICGISLEQKQGSLCVGIGINVHPPLSEKGQEDAPDAKGSSSARARGGSKNTPVYLADLVASHADGSAPVIDAVRGVVLAELADVYERWKVEGFGSLRKEFMEHFALEGFRIRIDETGDSRPVFCEVRDINELGHLIVLPAGERETREIAAGTVTIDSHGI